MTLEPTLLADKTYRDLLELGPRIRALRLKKKLTLQAVAERARVSQSLISQVERGLASPSVNTLRRIAGALDVPIAALFLGGSMSDDEIDVTGSRLAGSQRAEGTPRPSLKGRLRSSNP